MKKKSEFDEGDWRVHNLQSYIDSLESSMKNANSEEFYGICKSKLEKALKEKEELRKLYPEKYIVL